MTVKYLLNIIERKKKRETIQVWIVIYMYIHTLKNNRQGFIEQLLKRKEHEKVSKSTTCGLVLGKITKIIKKS